MSFGESPSDIITVVAFCGELYRKCRAAGGEYDETTREVRGLHTVLKHLKSEVKDGDSPLNKDRSIWVRQLAPIISDCNFTLKQLNGLLFEYGRLFGGSAVENGSSKISWDGKRFGNNEMDRLGAIRVKMTSHKTSLTVFLDTIQLQEQGNKEMGLSVQREQLDIILDKVDHIAARMSHKGGTFMTSYEDGDKEIWKQFRRRLIAEGFSSDVLRKHKDVLRAYIRQMEQDGLLAREPPTLQIPSPMSPHPERWINSTHSKSSHAQPLSFDSIGRDDSGVKEMIQREENVRFPTSMKLERLKPEPHLDTWFEGQPERQPSSIRGQLSPSLTPKISAAQLIKPERQLDTSGSEYDTSSIHRHQTKSPPNIIQTSDLSLFPVIETPQLFPPPSPSTHHLQSHPNEATRSMALKPSRRSDRATSKRTRRVRFDLSDSQPSPKMNTPVTVTSPRHDSTVPVARLGPDSNGKEISPGAIWTRVKRSLISLEVLDQDGRRYEVRPESVAILGFLTKEEIQNYASRSHTLREERWRKHHLVAMGPEEGSTKEKLPETRRRRNSSCSDSSSGGNSTSASDSDSGWNSDSESESDSNSDSESDSNSDSDSDDDSHRKKGKGQDKKESNVDKREDRRERGERGDEQDRAERRECVERNDRDREPSYTFSPTPAPYLSSPKNQSQPFAASPNTYKPSSPRNEPQSFSALPNTYKPSSPRNEPQSFSALPNTYKPSSPRNEPQSFSALPNTYKPSSPRNEPQSFSALPNTYKPSSPRNEPQSFSTLPNTYQSSPRNERQSFSTLPSTVPIDTPSLSNIPGLDQSLHGYAPPPMPFLPQQAFLQPSIYPIRTQEAYAPGPSYPDPFLSPHLYADPPHSPFSSIPTYPPSQSTSFRLFPSSSNKAYDTEHIPRRRSHRRSHSHSHHSRDRDYNSHRSRNRDRDRDRDRHRHRDADGFGRTPLTGSGWRDHLAVAGLGGAALGFLTLLSETADGL
ncbi:2791c622-aff8-4e39-aaf0-0d036e68079a [Sclerotinia trifoliorum]|uniref:2791c622-aff8-4e39-aaf0-0d036e68079a n=1 Tax=Sclerotinia trifoliorum TaxID=28548 RepID=A0A8H2ZNI3_9HELO|nr:2791c622-aff8-4e39-aaf0-0d036e68079a [Sclerotinia trifoliorum]